MTRLLFFCCGWGAYALCIFVLMPPMPLWQQFTLVNWLTCGAYYVAQANMLEHKK